MTEFEAWAVLALLIIGAICWYIDGVKKYNPDKYAQWQFKKLPKEEQERRIQDAERRERISASLNRLCVNRDIERQYLEHYGVKEGALRSDPEVPWVPEDVRAYAREEMRRSSMYPEFQRSGCLKTFETCFAKERMIRDRACRPADLKLPYDLHLYKEPEEYLVEQIWSLWKFMHYPEVVQHYKETGEFLSHTKWRPLKSIPDWNDGKNSALKDQ